jgi:hypothetical protein
MARTINMSIDKTNYKIALTNHLFKTRTGEKKSISRIQDLTINQVREFIRTAVTAQVLSSNYTKFVITYPRTDKFFSAILVVKENTDFVVVSIFHSTMPYKNKGLFPNEKIGFELNAEQYINIINAHNPHEAPTVKKVVPLMRKIKRVAIA